MITHFKEKLSLQDATFTQIVHEEAMVAIVYRITTPKSAPLILKICPRANDVLREVYFLTNLQHEIPVPRLLDVVEPTATMPGAILMECLPGRVMEKVELNQELAFELGTILARLHCIKAKGYGDPIEQDALNFDPEVYFSSKFQEGYQECAHHFSEDLKQNIRAYFEEHRKLIQMVDGPCHTHRDFRPGNVIVHDGKLQGIIDWSSGRLGFAEEDFYPLDESHEKTSFLSGYKAIRPAPHYKAIMPLLRLNRALNSIGFTLKFATWESTHKHFYNTNRQFIESLF